MKIELTMHEVIRLEQAAELISHWGEDDPESDMKEIATLSKSAHLKLQGALERAGCRKVGDGDWKLPPLQRKAAVAPRRR